VLAICPGSVATNFFDEHHDKFDPKREKILAAKDVTDVHASIFDLPIYPSLLNGMNIVTMSLRVPILLGRSNPILSGYEEILLCLYYEQ
jgi:hypothetical protein